jgi:hypothetical protein
MRGPKPTGLLPMVSQWNSMQAQMPSPQKSPAWEKRRAHCGLESSSTDAPRLLKSLIKTSSIETNCL